MDKEIIANLKSLGIDMINKAGSGHPGIVLSAAPIIYTIYANHMNVNVNDSSWMNRDRFVLSAGHGSALLYACLYMAGFLDLKGLKEFRRLGSKTPGHPEYQTTKGVDVSTGPLGQGLATAVGLAIGEKKLQTKFDNKIINYNIYVLCGDGDLMEGISYESASLAGTLKLDNLIVLYDSNNISLDGSTENTFTENVRERFDSFGWFTTLVKDGTKPEEIDKAINRAKKSGLPSLIEVKTILGKGSINEGTNIVHGKPLNKEDIKNLKAKLNIPDEEFYINDKAIAKFREYIEKRSNEKYNTWNNYYKQIINQEEILKFKNKIIEFKYDDKNFLKCKKESTRESNSKILNFLASASDLLFGGSADVASSTKTYIKEKGIFTKDNYSGSNIMFGVREHAMGAILNGLALSGFLPFGSTFLAFSDYLKPAIRMSALMNLPVTYIFTHDSIHNSEDGPTHEPIEQLASLRLIPNLKVYRPADFNETLGAWKAILTLHSPSALILSKKEIPNLNNTNPEKVLYGGYIVKKENAFPDAILISTGIEVSTCINIAKKLENKGYNIRVVSMPCISLFKQTNKKYQNQILPVGIKKFFIEPSCKEDLRDFVTNEKYLITVNEFGYSGNEKEVLKKMNFSEEKILNRIEELL